MDKKVKIGILTYHGSNNYGAFMQAYSLSNRLRMEHPNCSIEIIDYISKEVYCLYNKSLKGYLYLLMNASPFRRKLVYLKRMQEYYFDILKGRNKSVDDCYFEEGRKLLPLSAEKMITDDYTAVVRYINQNYDIVIVGSDAVWNWQIRPFPNVYFLGPDIETKKLSYAASSYEQRYDNLSQKIRLQIKQGWSTFDYIGVRDVPTEGFVRSIVNSIEPNHNCDPTVFLDMDNLPVDKEKVYRKLIEAGFDPTRKSIALMAQPWLAKYIKQLVGNEYQLVSVFKQSEYANVNLLDINPFEWAICFGFFNLTITHYFHGNLLSLKNGTPTVCIEQKTEYNSRYESKIRDFMNRIGLLKNCYYYEDITDGDSVKTVIDNLSDDTAIKQLIKDQLDIESSTYKSFDNALKVLLHEQVVKN